MKTSNLFARLARLIVAGVLALLPATLVAPAARAEDAPTRPLAVGMVGGVDSFNPFVASKAITRELYQFTYDYLTEYSEKDLTPTPALAESWEASPDGKEWRFKIRTGVTWNDGQPLTAKDIAWTYSQCINKGPGASAWGSYLKDAERVTAPDDTTVVINFTKPNAVMPYLPIPILPQHVWSKMSPEEITKHKAEPPNLVSSGPFDLVDGTASGSAYSYRANAKHWRGKPAADQINLRLYNAQDPMVQGLIKGDIDFAGGVSPVQLKALEGKGDIKTKLSLARGFDHIGFNAGAIDSKSKAPVGDGHAAVRDPKFRHALGYAIDRDLIAANAYQGGGAPGQTIIPSTYPAYHAEPDSPYTFDLAKAGQLLDEAGYRTGPDGKRTMPDGKPIGTLRLYGDAKSDSATSSMKYLQEWFGKIGVETRPEPMDTNRLNDQISAGTYDIFHWGWAVRPDPDAMLSFITCAARSGSSDTFYCNPEYDRLYAAQHGEQDRGKRIGIVKKMQQMAFTEAPYQVLVFNKTSDAWRSDRIEGFVPRPSPDGSLLLGYGAASLLKVHPVAAQKSASSTPGAPAIAGVAAGVVVLGAVAFLVLRSRRRTVDERE